jgi:hypothetical protein
MMKGVVFSEFVEMVEDVYSPELADEIIEESRLPSGGAYTAVGTYDHAEMLTLIAKLSEKTGAPEPRLVKDFGSFLFGRFVALYPSFFEGVDGTFAFLARIEDHVHSEVRKLYHDAELPTFITHQPGPDALVMVYKSKRPFADLALGLIQGCIAYYGETIDVEQQNLSGDERTHVRFILTRR